MLRANHVKIFKCTGLVRRSTNFATTSAGKTGYQVGYITVNVEQNFPDRSTMVTCPAIAWYCNSPMMQCSVYSLISSRLSSIFIFSYALKKMYMVYLFASEKVLDIHLK